MSTLTSSSTEPEQDNISLRKLFYESLKQHGQLTDWEGGSNDAKYQDSAKQLVERLAVARQLVDQLGLFSVNEEIDDINTHDLKYLLVPALLIDVLLKLSSNAQSQADKEDARFKVLEQAITIAKDYLESLEISGLLKDQDKSVLLGKEPSDPAAKRAAKIASFKREKETKLKLEQLLEKTRKTSSLAKANAGQEYEDDGDVNFSTSATIDEEAERALALTLLDHWIQKTCENLVFAKQEMELLEHSKSSRQHSNNSDSRVKTNVDSLSVVNASRKPMKPFVITRDMIQRNMFGLGYSNLPTMSVEEFLELEMKRGNMLSGGANEDAIRQEQENKKALEEDSDAASDQATYKARDWDEFTDNNPRGAGNRMNRS